MPRGGDTSGKKLKSYFFSVAPTIIDILKKNCGGLHVVGGSRSGKSYKVGRGGACTKKTPPAQYSLTLRGEFKLQALFYNSFCETKVHLLTGVVCEKTS